LPGRQLLFAHDIATVLANGGEDDAGDPVLEGTGFRLVGAHGDLVEAALAYELGVGHAFTTDRCSGYFIIRQRAQCVPRVDAAIAFRGIGNGTAHVRSYEPRLTVDLDDADGVGVEGVGGKLGLQDRGAERGADGRCGRVGGSHGAGL